MGWIGPAQNGRVGGEVRAVITCRNNANLHGKKAFTKIAGKWKRQQLVVDRQVKGGWGPKSKAQWEERCLAYLRGLHCLWLEEHGGSEAGEYCLCGAPKHMASQSPGNILRSPRALNFEGTLHPFKILPIFFRPVAPPSPNGPFTAAR